MTLLKTDSGRQDARTTAYLALSEIFGKAAYANLTVHKYIRRGKLGEADRRLFTELTYGTVRRWNYLLWIMEQLSGRKAEKIDCPVRILLGIGLYQMIFLDRIPESAAVNETVKLTKKFSNGGAAKFANAVLRSYQRKKGSLSIPGRDRNTVQFLSLTYNQPEWLIRRWIRQFGEKTTEQCCLAFDRIPGLDVRCNTQKISRAELTALLRSSGAEAEPLSFVPEGIRIHKNPDSLEKASWLRDGLAYIQNGASMIPAHVLDPAAGEKILDMCAAPGSKTTHIAQLMNDRGHIDAWDIYPHKIELIRRNASRMGLNSITAECRDASLSDSGKKEQYDRVLLDAPCSGLGVIGRKPEMRWTRQEEDMAHFPVLQAVLLDRAAEFLKAGGILVYSTCTLNPEENENEVHRFLERHPDFILSPWQRPPLPSSLSGMLTLWPAERETDGFFVARMEKIRS